MVDPAELEVGDSEVVCSVIKLEESFVGEVDCQQFVLADWSELDLQSTGL